MEDNFGNLIKAFGQGKRQRIVCGDGRRGRLRQRGQDACSRPRHRTWMPWPGGRPWFHEPVARVTPAAARPPEPVRLRPLIYQVGRACWPWAGFPLTARDVAVRVNFCTLDKSGLSSTAGPGEPDERDRPCGRRSARRKPRRQRRRVIHEPRRNAPCWYCGGDALTGTWATDPQVTACRRCRGPPPHEDLADGPVRQRRDQPGPPHPGRRARRHDPVRCAKFPTWPTFRSVAGLTRAVAGYPMYREKLARLVSARGGKSPPPLRTSARRR